MKLDSTVSMGRVVALVALLALPAFAATPAGAWINDADANKIDDRIEAVHANGLAWAFEDRDVTKRMLIGVFQGAPLRYAIYVGYHHHPTAADETALRGVVGPTTPLKTYLYIDYTRTEATFGQIQAIAALPGVKRIEAIPMYYPTNHLGSRVVRARDSRGLIPPQDWVLFPSARGNLGLDGSGIVIGILDTGVNDVPSTVNPNFPGHESFTGKFVGGGNFFAGDPLLNTPLNGSENPQDNVDYHGTHVAGSALGTGGPSGFFAGVAPAAKLVDCKALSDAGVGFGSADAVEWCIANKNRVWPGQQPGDPYNGIDVINLSLGCLQCNSDGTEADTQMLNAAMNAGIVVCVSSGNSGGQGQIGSPGSADLAITVGATSHGTTLERSDDRVTDFSNEGPRLNDGDGDQLDEYKPNVVAPGLSIVSADGDITTDGTQYSTLSGTSMSSPHVAGVAALVRQANPSLTALQIKQILQNTAEHGIRSNKGDRPADPSNLDPNYNPMSGWGLVDVYAAAKEALNSTHGVQVVQFRPVGRGAFKAVDVNWTTQREFSFQGFHVYRAPDVAGTPGAFTRINANLVPPSPDGDPVIDKDDNRTYYTYFDDDPALVEGVPVWYRLSWVDSLGAEHFEPPAPGTPASGLVSRCTLPGIPVLTDIPGDQDPDLGTPAHDVQVVSFAEPYFGSPPDRLVVTMKVAELTEFPLNSSWRVFWRSPDDTLRFVNMDNFDPVVGLRFRYGWIEEGPNSNISRARGPADFGKWDPDGTIEIHVAHNKVGFTGPGAELRSVGGRSEVLVGVTAGLLQFMDETATGGPYHVKGNAFCTPPTVTCADDFIAPADPPSNPTDHPVSFQVHNPSTTARTFNVVLTDDNGWLVGGPFVQLLGPVPAGGTAQFDAAVRFDSQCRPAAVDNIRWSVAALDDPNLEAECTTVATCEMPVPALVSRLEARGASGGVELAWFSEAAGQVSAWNLYRGPSLETAYAPVNATPIPMGAGGEFRFVDPEAGSSGAVVYRLTAIGSDGAEIFVASTTVRLEGVTAFEFGLAGPSPFRGHTALRYALPARAPVQVRVYDAAGRLRRTLVDRVEEAGVYTVSFQLRDGGAALAPGVYLVRLTAGSHDRTVTVVAVE